jgi:hypothetical protein
MTTRRSLWVWLLPFFLLLAQYGEYRHELTHYTKKATEPDKKAPRKSDVCQLCLAYGHMGGAAKPELDVTSLLAGLSFHYQAEPAFASANTTALATRNRGPPNP